MPTVTLEQTLRQNRQSLTRPRQLVFDALKNKPLLMSELIEKVNIGVDRATVYRVVDLFERLGIVIRLSQGFKYRLELSDLFLPHHHHLTCTNCHRVLEFDEPTGFAALVEKVSGEQAFTSSRHRLEIEGSCQSCSKLKT